MTSGEITAIVTVLGTVLGFFGVTVDPAILQNGVAGLLSFVVLISAIWTWWKHRQAVQQTSTI